MNLFSVIFLLPVHGVVVLATAWLWTRILLPRTAGDLEQWLGWSWASVATIATGGVVLAAAGDLGAAGFWAWDGLMLALLLAWRRAAWREDLAAMGSLGRRLVHFLRSAGASAWLAASLIVLLLGLGLLSLWAEPVVYDTLTYRLPRIAQWLQDGRITMVVADEPRINYMPVVPDLVMAWFIAGAGPGFHLSAAAQAMGGVLTVGATVGLARLTGLGRPAALGAGLLLFTMANVVPQFTSGHTDLFTAGVFAAAFYLWLAALRRGEVSLIGALGAGLALGSKGTLFYLAPGALLWVGWLAWRHKLPVRAWFRTIGVAVAGLALFAIPGLVRNGQAYGGLFGPAEHVRMHHGTNIGLPGKLAVNLVSSLAQSFEPNSQPWPWRGPARAVGAAIAQRLPEHDGRTLEDISRRGTLLAIMARAEPDADTMAFGLFASGLFFAGLVTALLDRKRAGAGLVVLWGAGVVVFLLFFHAMQQWHPFGFRYFVLVAPWLAVVGAWGIEAWPRPARLTAWGLALLTGAGVGWLADTATYQSGWRAVTQPERARGYYVFEQWRAWADRLDSPDQLLRVALPDRRPLAAFYRQPEDRRVELRPQAGEGVASAEAFAPKDFGWVIVPAGRFLGREGNVQVRTWLFEGDETSPFSLAAYRLRQPDERPAPVLYRQRRTAEGAEVRWDLLVKAWTGPAVLLELVNDSAVQWRYRILSPGAPVEGGLSPAERKEVQLSLAANEVSQVMVIFSPVGAATPADAPRVGLPAYSTR